MSSDLATPSFAAQQGLAADTSQPGVSGSGNLLAFNFLGFGEAGQRWLAQLKPDPVGGVRLEQGAALVAAAWLIGAVLVMGQSIRRGRSLAEKLAERHPEVYEALGRPRPGYLHSVRRDKFAQFVGRRGYEALADPVLVSEFDAYRKSEARLVVSILASMLVVVVFLLAVRHAT